MGRRRRGRRPPGAARAGPDPARTLLLSAEIRRVRVCGAHRSALRLVDRSPAHNRRWCSTMSRCGTEVRLRRARTVRGGRTRRTEPTTDSWCNHAQLTRRASDAMPGRGCFRCPPPARRGPVRSGSGRRRAHRIRGAGPVPAEPSGSER
ncbi:CGNR zinc finger domain-containing protein [Streptomyces sp. NPDC006259]|uniref:CGNR zinc finger domain-containing protein n=1 Tax=Streptomyces sp. NPDC006259 TaxID=3364740 RepID=UPI0036C79D06